MNTKVLLFIIVLLASTSASYLVSRSFRVAQIPNGGKNRCANCHVNPAGGGARNDFGKEVGSNHLDGGGNVQWSPALAQLDSDGDGFTNGQELQDPAGTWTAGSPAPGDPSLVTNPGDASDFPTTTSVQAVSASASAFQLHQNYPNPFNPSTTIRFALQTGARVHVAVFSTDGELVRTLVDEWHDAGTYSTTWDGRNNARESVGSGAYLYRMSSGHFVDTRRMLLVK